VESVAAAPGNDVVGGAPRIRSARVPRLLLRILLVVATLAATAAAALVLGPPLHGLLEGAGLDLPYVKTFRYLLLGLLVGVGAVALRPWRDVPPDLWGLRGPRSRPGLAAAGALVGVGALVAVAALDALAGNLVWDVRHGREKALDRLPAALLGGVLVGLVEEVFFRGWLFHRFRRSLSVAASAGLVAVVFAGVHAFRASPSLSRIGPGVEEGGRILAAWARHLVDPHGFGPSFVGLLALSLALTASYLRFRTLWFAVGLHGAAVAYLPLHSAATERLVARDWLGSKWLYDGVPGWALLGLLAALLWPRRPPPAPDA
jgi:membrane protease YdiL (CAAX protease family)